MSGNKMVQNLRKKKKKKKKKKGGGGVEKINI